MYTPHFFSKIQMLLGPNLDTVPHTHFVDSVMTPFVDSVTHFVDSVTHFVDSATHLLIL